MKITLYLIRHGESLGNMGVSRKSDSGLSLLGRHQAVHCSEYLRSICPNPAAVLSSPFKRCLNTAQSFAENIVLEPLLHEFFPRRLFFFKWAVFPTLAEISANYQSVADTNDNGRWWPRRSETQDELKSRLSQFIQQVMQGTYGSGGIVCFTHAPVITALVSLMEPELCVGRIGNASITKLVLNGISWDVEYVGKEITLEVDC